MVRMLKDRAHLVAREHHGEAGRPAGTHDVIEPGQLDSEHLAIEEQERAQRLILGGSRHAALDGERAEEARHLWSAELGGMALAVKEDVAPDPGDAGFLGAATVMPDPERRAHPIEQAGLRRGGLAHEGRRGVRPQVAYNFDRVGRTRAIALLRGTSANYRRHRRQGQGTAGLSLPRSGCARAGAGAAGTCERRWLAKGGPHRLSPNGNQSMRASAAR